MISIIISILLFLTWIAICMESIFCFFEKNRPATGTVLALVAIVMMAYAIDQSNKYDAEHPCAEYETRMQYNAATKTVMPMRVCVQRGEWVTE